VTQDSVTLLTGEMQYFSLSVYMRACMCMCTDWTPSIESEEK